MNTAVQLLSYQDVSKMTGIALGTLYAAVHRRKLPHIRLGPRTVRFLRRDIEGWINGGYRPAEDDEVDGRAAESS